jgi:hypothetical protein
LAIGDNSLSPSWSIQAFFIILYRTLLINNASERFIKLPRRIFLDTNVIQSLYSFSSFIWDNFMDDEEYKKFDRLDSETKADVEALQPVFQIGQRASFAK